MADNEAKIEEVLKRAYPTAKDFTFQVVEEDFVSCSVYYVEFECEDYEKADSYSYVVVNGSGSVKLYSDGIEAIGSLKNLLDKRRSFFQRLSEFSFFELVSGVIAISITIVFVYLCFAQQKINEYLVGIFGIIVGFYFGKNNNTKQ